MKVGIIGSGMVGATSAYAIMMRKAASDIVLIDANEKRTIAEAQDIMHAVPFASATDIYAGSYKDLKDAKIVVIAAGASQKPGETRLMLMEKNASIMKDIISHTAEVNPNVIFLVATNPVDIITHICIDIAKDFGIPSTRIIGSGTTLDTARFRSLLGSHIGVDPQHVHAYVVGEHGDSEVLCWSNVDIGGVPLEDFIAHRNIEFYEEIKNKIDDGVRNAAYKIIEGKGSTYYGVAGAIAKLVEVINRDNRAVLTISALQDDVEGIKNVTLSLPHLIGGDGDLGVMTGDSARRDEDGYYWIIGRVDDVIKVSGYRLGTAEIESALVSHPAVAEAAAIGLPHEVKGHAIHTFVILKTGYQKSDKLIEELRQHVGHEVGPIAKPEQIEIVESLPKTRSGKIMRRVLKARALGIDPGNLSTLEE